MRESSNAAAAPFSTSISAGALLSPTRAFARLASRRCRAQRSPLSTPVFRPTVPTVLATGEPMLRSMNSAPDLKRGEYDFEVV
jgi:hypothetical protein